jgi:hypothetical protein
MKLYMASIISPRTVCFCLEHGEGSGDHKCRGGYDSAGGSSRSNSIDSWVDAKVQGKLSRCSGLLLTLEGTETTTSGRVAELHRSNTYSSDGSWRGVKGGKQNSLERALTITSRTCDSRQSVVRCRVGAGDGRLFDGRGDITTDEGERVDASHEDSRVAGFLVGLDTDLDDGSLVSGGGEGDCVKLDSKCITLVSVDQVDLVGRVDHLDLGGHADLANLEAVGEIDVQGHESLEKVHFNLIGGCVGLETETDTEVDLGSDGTRSRVFTVDVLVSGDGGRLKIDVNSKNAFSVTTTSDVGVTGKELLAGREDSVTDRNASFLALSVPDGVGDHVVVDKVGDLVVEVEVESIVGEDGVGNVPLLGEALKATALGLGRGDRRGGKKERSKFHLVYLRLWLRCLLMVADKKL